jgi:hypothetical protein
MLASYAIETVYAPIFMAQRKDSHIMDAGQG